MTRAEEKLSALLHGTTAGVTGGVRFDDVARRVSRRRRFATVVSAAAVAVLAAGAVVSVAAAGGGGQGDGPAVGSHRKQVSSPSRRVTFEGVVFTLPTGWRLALPGCGSPASRTVVVDHQTGPVLLCPDLPSPARLATAVTLTTIYGPRYAVGWDGRRTTWHHQPAWLAVRTNHWGTTLTLTLPWLNAAITAESSRSERAWALLGRLSAHSVPGLAAPKDAASIFVQSLAGHDGDGLTRNNTVTDAADVRRLLADLRSLRPVKSASAACGGSWEPGSALLTVRPSHGPERTYAARFGSCRQVMAGTGAAAATSGTLLSDIRRLVPNSGL